MSQIECKPTTIEATKVMDISNLNHNMKSDVFVIDDLKWRILIFPNGSGGTNIGDHSLISVKVVNGAGIRKLFFSIKFDSNDQGTSVHTVSQCTENDIDTKNIFGRSFPTQVFKTSSILEISVKLHYDPLFVYRKPSLTFQEQLMKMHKLSKSMGDITLIVKIIDNDNENNESYALYVPPNKKQKLDHNQAVHRIRISSILLKSASNVFERMLDPNNNMIEYQNKEIIVYAQNVEDVHDLIHFMSTNTLRMDCNALTLVHLAHFYDMDRLFWECINRLIKNVSIDNFVRTIHTFERYRVTKEGYKALVPFAIDNWNELKNTHDFLELSHQFLVYCIGATDK